LLVCGLTVFATFITCRTPAAERVNLNAHTMDQIQALQDEKQSRSPVEKKLDSQILYGLKERRNGTAVQKVATLRSALVPEQDGRLLVDLQADVTPNLLGVIQANGGKVINNFARYHSVRALIPLAQLEALAAQPSVRWVRPADRAALNTAGVCTEGDISHRADQARNQFQVDGSGVKIGVLSDSVDYLANVQSSGGLSNVTVLPGQAGSGSGEGTAMLQIVNTLAPGADLYFATAFAGVASFAQNIRDLQAAGCRIIVDDVLYFNESPFQDGPISQAVNDVCAAGCLFFSSAGNSGALARSSAGTWEGDFKDGGPATFGRGGRVHDFGGVTYNTVLFGGGSFRRIDFFWADPLGNSTNDYDVYVLDSTGSVVRSSTNVQDGSQDPYENVPTLNTGDRIVIVKYSGENRYLYVSAGRGFLSIPTAGSVRGHNAAGAPNAFSVAATKVGTPPQPFVGAPANQVEWFSSDGPRRIFFNSDGTAITPTNFSSSGGLLLQKPDITAADGNSSSVPGFTPFFGTSAAAPHAAAIAGLIWSYSPFLKPTAVRSLLTSNALDLDAPGNDPNSGVGIVMAYQTLTATPSVALQSIQVRDASGNALLDPNECVDLVINLQNTGQAPSNPLTGISAVLSTSASNIVVDPAPHFFADIPPDGSSTSSVPFRISTTPLFSYGTNFNFLLHVTSSNNLSFDLPFQLDSPQPLGPNTNFATSATVPIPDLGIAEAPLTVSGVNWPLGIIKASVHVTHTFDSDLRLSLVAPDGTEVFLSSNRGDGGHDYGTSCNNMTVFSDDAAASIASGTAPFLGSFRAEQPLSTLSGKSGNQVNGVWLLRAKDVVQGDTGAIQCWSLDLTAFAPVDGGGQCLNAPEIVQGPSDQIVNDGQSVQFMVQVQGTAPLSYQWYFNQTTSLPNGTNATLQLSNVSPNQSGQYNVLVTNPYGSIASPAAQLTVTPLPPTILTNPASQFVTNGETVTLTVTAHGTAPMTYQWYFDDTNALTGETNSVLVLPNFTANQVGSFVVVVTNDYGSVTSSPAQLTLVAAPTISCGTNRTVELGTAWDFDSPSVTGSNPVLTILSTVTNLNCGASFTATRSWMVTDDTGFQETCSQTVTLIDTTPPLLSCAPNKSVPYGQEWTFDTPTFQDASPVTLTVLDTTTNSSCGSGFTAIRTWQSVDACGNGATCAQTVSVVDGRPPQIVTQPSGQLVFAGGNATFETVVSSCPPLAYQWYFNETNILATETNAILVLTNVAIDQAGSYSVVLTNDYGSTTSVLAVLNVVTTPRIDLDLTNQVATNGDTVLFAVSASGTGPLTYQWFFNETNRLNLETNSTLLLTNVSSPQAGIYSVVLANGFGSVTTALAQLTVLVPAFIADQPSNQVATVGGSAVFYVGAAGTAPLTYQWHFNQTVTLDNETNAILALNNITPAQAGTYEVIVANAYGSVTSAPATLAVGLAPVIITSPTNQIATNGDMVLLVAEAQGTDPLTYQWYFNETNSLPDATNALLELTNVTTSQSGNYQLVVANPYGSVTSVPAQLSVVVPAFIASGPTNLTATNGDTVVLTVTAQGTAPLSYQWYFNLTNALEGETNSTLVFSNATPALAGLYAVSVLNAYGSATSAPAQLSIIVLPTISCGTNRTVELGANWDFDTPAFTGGNAVLTVLSTTTNAGCGESFSATRTWIVTEDGGYAATCSQTVQVVDTSAPVMVCPADKSLPYGSSWSFDSPAAQDAGVADVLVYDNLANDLLTPVDLGGTEIGNEITLDGSARYPTRFAFQYWGTNAGQADFQGNVQLRVRFYQNDGPLLNLAATPGTLIFDSGEFPVAATNQGTITLENFQLSAVTPLNGPLPSSFTWTLQFSGLASNDSAGVMSFGPPVVGQLRSENWELAVDGWILQTNVPASSSFGAQLETVSRGVNLQVLSTETNADCGRGFTAVRTWQAVDACGNSSTCTQTVSVVDQGPPLIVAQPQNQLLVTGSTGILSVTVSSCPPLAYQWYFDETNRLDLETNATLVLTNVTPAQAGSYVVVVTNAHGTVTSTPAFVSVGSAPMLTSVPTNQTVTTGDTVTFAVSALGAEPLSYQWYFNATNILDSETNVLLVLQNVAPQQAGSYMVVVTNLYASVTSPPAQLTLLLPPSILSGPTSQVVSNGATVSFTVTAQGTEPLVYQWYFNGTNLLTGVTNASCLLTNVGLTNAGDYNVSISNALGSVLSQPASLRVLVPPRIISVARIGGVFSLTFSTVPGLIYEVYYKDDLDAPTWTALPKKAILRLGTGAPMTATDVIGPSPSRFYTVIVQ